MSTSHSNPKDPSPPQFFVCVGSVVIKDNKVLFIRQATGESLEGQWSIPWGFVDSNETPEEAAIRETLEESGIQAQVTGLLGFQNLPQPGWIGIVFLCHHVEGDPKGDGIETDRAAYLNKKELKNLNDPIEPWCEWIAHRVLGNNATVIPAEPNNPYHPKIAFL